MRSNTTVIDSFMRERRRNWTGEKNVSFKKRKKERERKEGEKKERKGERTDRTRKKTGVAKLKMER